MHIEDVMGIRHHDLYQGHCDVIEAHATDHFREASVHVLREVVLGDGLAQVIDHIHTQEASVHVLQGAVLGDSLARVPGHIQEAIVHVLLVGVLEDSLAQEPGPTQETRQACVGEVLQGVPTQGLIREMIVHGLHEDDRVMIDATMVQDFPAAEVGAAAQDIVLGTHHVVLVAVHEDQEVEEDKRNKCRKLFPCSALG